MQIIIPLTLLSSFIPGLRGSKTTLFYEGWTYIETLSFHSVILIATLLLILILNRLKAIRLTEGELKLTTIDVKVDSISKRKLFNSELYIIKSDNSEEFLLLNHKFNQLAIEKGQIQKIHVESRSKVILNLKKD